MVLSSGTLDLLWLAKHTALTSLTSLTSLTPNNWQTCFVLSSETLDLLWLAKHTALTSLPSLTSLTSKKTSLTSLTSKKNFFSPQPSLVWRRKKPCSHREQGFFFICVQPPDSQHDGEVAGGWVVCKWRLGYVQKKRMIRITRTSLSKNNVNQCWF